MASRDLAQYLTPALLEQLGDAVTIVDADWRYRYASAYACEVMGRPLEEIIGTRVWEIFPEVLGTPQYDACLRAMEQRTRERIVWFFDSVGRWMEQHALPVGDGLVILVNDITEQEAAARRSGQLVAVGEALAGATTYEEVNAALVDRVIPLVGAAGGTILIADEDRKIMRAIDWAGVDTELVSRWSEFPISLRTPSSDAYRTGLPVYLEDLSSAHETYPEVATELARIGRHTLAALPLTSAGVRLGAVVVNFESERQLSVGDKQFLVTSAAMTAQALMRATLLDAQRESITALQRSLLPPAVTAVEGIDVAVRYVASNATSEVGGDWYDVIPLDGGALGVVMGDVEGHDLGAAALMGLVRSAVRAYALEGHPPAIVLARANTFLASLRRGRIVTVAYAQLHPIERLITTTSAGHPAVQVAPREGDVYEVPTEVGPPFGVFDDGLRWPETTSTLPAGCALAMFTDGLVEVRTESIYLGIERVRALLGARRSEDPEALADALLASRPDGGRDDVALLVGRLTADADRPRHLRRRLPPTPASVFLARRFTTQLLTEWDIDVDVVDAAELVMSELVTNAARHSEDAIEVGLTCEASVLRIEVGDTSHRMPTEIPELTDIDDEATGGRGLPLVALVAARWGVDSEGLSKKVWAEFDLPD